MRLSVKMKLAAAFGVVIMLTASVGGISYYKLSALNDTVDRILDQRVAAFKTATNVRSLVNKAIRAEKNSILDPVDSRVAEDVLVVNNTHQEVADLLRDTLASASPEIRPYFEKIKQSYDKNWSTQQKTIVVAQQNSQSKAHDLIADSGRKNLHKCHRCVV